MSAFIVAALSIVLLNGHRFEIISSASVIHAIVWASSFALSEAGIIFAGHLVNITMQKHRFEIQHNTIFLKNVTLCRSVLALHVLTTKHRLQTFFDKTPSSVNMPRNTGSMIVSNRDTADILLFNKISDALHTAELLLNILQHRDDFEAVKVLGIKCNSQIPLWIVSTMGLIAFIAVQVAFFGTVLY